MVPVRPATPEPQTRLYPLSESCFQSSQTIKTVGDGGNSGDRKWAPRVGHERGTFDAGLSRSIA